MTKANDTQLRGHCQCCCRQQAVVSALMSKHGYQVKSSWFVGICRGQHYEPMEVSRVQTDDTIRSVRAECKALRQRADDLRAGKVTPKEAKTGNKVKVEGKSYWQCEDEMVAFSEAPAHHQKEAIQSAAWNADQRAKMGESFCNDLERTANEYHGKPLIEVKRDAGPAPILSGEQRKDARGATLTVKRVDGARVYWNHTNAAGKIQNGWTGTQAFRKLEILPTIPF